MSATPIDNLRVAIARSVCFRYTGAYERVVGSEPEFAFARAMRSRRVFSAMRRLVDDEHLRARNRR